MGIEAPIPLSTKLGDFSNIFHRIVRAAEHPHLSIPETSAGKSRKHYHRLINRSLVFISGILILSSITFLVFVITPTPPCIVYTFSASLLVVFEG